MELERELPTDDASMELDGEGSCGDVKPSDSMLTLKRSLSQETMTASLDQLPASSGLCSDAIHLDFLVQKGLIDYDSLDQQTGEDEAGDYSRRLISSSGLGGVAEIVKEMRNEFIGKLSSNVKGLKGILMKGLMEQEDGSSVLHANNIAAKNDAAVALEVPKLIHENHSPPEDLVTKDVYRRSEEIIHLTSDINQFTSQIERDPDNVDWLQFRANLQKIHRHYVRNPAARAMSQIGGRASDISVPLNDLRSQAHCLRRNIRGLESKMFTLDHTFQDFSNKLRRSEISKERVDHDMEVLSMMRDKIGQRLSDLEDEFSRARRQLFRGTRATGQKKPVLPVHNCKA